MQFTIKELKSLLSSINKLNITNINVQSKQLKLIINTAVNANEITNNRPLINKRNIEQNNYDNDRNKFDTKLQMQRIINESETDTYFTIISPMIGTFYRSPAPSEPSFVEINDLVKVNQTVCIIEAMKLMNEIDSEISGQIVEILVQDGDIVDCGQALMKVKPH
uniref:Biotin carboxyl carrier protein of acetyl-CoA carboxylase n=1 Tax=Rhodogorgon sp. TaxID=2485824 RepID=A0A3G3MHY4_9FLOR|nr:acetyl-CoA carboxylase biotin carboxyl carrier protein [Rhodogorgon sp.]